MFSAGEGEASVASSDDRCADTSQDGSEFGHGDVNKELDHNKVNDLAAELLKVWKDLKVSSTKLYSSNRTVRVAE